MYIFAEVPALILDIVFAKLEKYNAEPVIDTMLLIAVKS